MSGSQTPAPAAGDPPAPAADPAAPAPTALGSDPAAPAATALGADPAAPAAGDPPKELTPEEKAAKEAADKANSVPEEYKFKAPDGVVLNQAQLDAFAPVAKDLGLTQAQADKLVELQIGFATKAQQEQADAWAKLSGGWREAQLTDQEIGGTPEKLAENLGIANKVLDKFGTPELREAMNETGVGDHPELIRTFVKIGRLLGEDGLIPAGAGSQSDKTAAQIMFPTFK